MICPYCKRTIYGATGLQEAQKFQVHLNKCIKYNGVKPVTLFMALQIRADSGQ